MMNKKIKKILAVVSSMIVCAVSMTSVVANAKTGGWYYAPDDEVNLYTLSFTVNDEKYVLWQEATDYFSDYYLMSTSEPHRYITRDGQLATLIKDGMNVYVCEDSVEDGTYRGLYGFIYEYYHLEDGTILFKSGEVLPLSLDNYVLNDENKEILEKYLTDNNISYERDEFDRLSINAKTNNEYIQLCTQIKKDTGLMIGRSLFESVVSIDSIENASYEKTLDGDANNDGQLTIADATAIVQFLGNADEYPLSEQGMINADCYNTGDGVTGKDAAAIQMIEAGLAESFEEIETL